MSQRCLRGISRIAHLTIDGPIGTDRLPESERSLRRPAPRPELARRGNGRLERTGHQRVPCVQAGRNQELDGARPQFQPADRAVLAALLHRYAVRVLRELRLLWSCSPECGCQG